MKKRLLTLIFTLFVGTFSVFAQMSDPTSWTFSQKKTGDNEYALTFKATIQPGWTVYSMSTPAGGPMPTSITIEKVGEGIELVVRPRRVNQVKSMMMFSESMCGIIQIITP